MFRVKICGVMTPTDARLVADAGADAIGLNFVVGSPRRLEFTVARAVADAVPKGVLRVGVFAGVAAEEIRRVARLVGLDAIQLHGHLEPQTNGGDAAAYDPPELCAELASLLPGMPLIRAVRLQPDGPESPAESPHASGNGLAAARRWIEAARASGKAPDIAVVDAGLARGTPSGQLGGTGLTVDWEALTRAGSLGIPMALAGGLTPNNVANAMRLTGIGSVDTASGVESALGRKDPEKVLAFVAAALLRPFPKAF